MKKNNHRCSNCGHIKVKHNLDTNRCLVRGCRCNVFKDPLENENNK